MTADQPLGCTTARAFPMGLSLLLRFKRWFLPVASGLADEVASSCLPEGARFANGVFRHEFPNAPDLSALSAPIPSRLPKRASPAFLLQSRVPTGEQTDKPAPVAAKTRKP